MIYLMALLGYGDSLITGSILENKISASTTLSIVGTGVTQKVWELLKKPIDVNVSLFKDVPAFYTLKEHGVFAALRDARIFRRWANKILADDDIVIFEGASFYRNRWLLGKSDCTIVEVQRLTNAYTDRALVIGNIVGSHVWVDAASPRGVSERILINPSARSGRRTLTPSVIETIIEIAKIPNSNVSLIDLYGDLEVFKSKVDLYLRKPSLDEAVLALRQADRYIGPDSFFMHLAYYLRVPQLAFFWKNDVYFQPPGLLSQEGIFYFDDLSNITLLKGRLQTLILGGAGDRSAT